MFRILMILANKLKVMPCPSDLHKYAQNNYKNLFQPELFFEVQRIKEDKCFYLFLNQI